MTPTDTVEVTEPHVRLLRRMAISWDTTEFGAPTVEPAAPYGSTSLYADVAPLLGLPEVEVDEEPTPEDLARVMEAHQGACRAFEVLLDVHGLGPGRYEIEDRPAFLHDAGRLSWSTVDIRREVGDDLSRFGLVRFFQILKSVWIARRSMEQAEDAGPARIEVELGAEHLELLRHVSVRQQEHDERPTVIGNDPAAKKLETWIAEERLYPVPAVDPKRPYGERTDACADMAEILELVPADGDELSEEQVERLLGLHRHLQMVVQTVVQHGTIEPGTYRRENGRWCYSSVAASSQSR